MTSTKCYFNHCNNLATKEMITGVKVLDIVDTYIYNPVCDYHIRTLNWHPIAVGSERAIKEEQNELRNSCDGQHPSQEST